MTQPAVSDAAANAVYEALKKIRSSKTCSLKPTPMLRTEIVDLAGRTVPFRLRYYQVQGIMHLLMLRRMILGDGTGLGKTIQMLGSLCYLWEREKDNRVIVVTPKSATRQWASEVNRFTTGIKVFIVSGKLEERKATWEAWAKYNGPDKPLLIVNYHLLIRDWDYGQKVALNDKGKPDPKRVTPGLVDGLTRQLKNLVTIYDEATAFKNTSTKTWQTCKFLSERSHRCYGLTATLLKNNLMEGFGIYKVIYPTMPGFTTKTAFLNEFCVTKLQPVRGGRKVPIVVGYRNLQRFRDIIDPYFLGRPKHQVSDELPTLITKEITCELGEAEAAKYQEALSGVLELGDGEIKDFEEHKAFVSLIYCQQVVNSLTMLKFSGGDEVLAGIYKDEGIKVKELGAKESTLVELLSEELDGEKTIIYTRFASLVPRLQEVLYRYNIPSVAITGKQNDKQRQAAQEQFQDMQSDIKVIFITDAGSEAINLQAASAMVFYDAPWSWGNYVQLLGRPIRIGSVHQHVVVYHLVSERPADTAKERHTIDRYVINLLEKKKDLIDKVIGEAAVGALTFEKGESTTRELVRKMQGKDD
jgi:SNF2 family DNA or RNA helicase